VKAPLLLVALLGCGGSGSSLGDACSLTDECAEGVCDFTAPDGPECISATGDLDGDGIPNDKDFCQHAMGGESDEDRDGIGDDCDRCPIAAPRAEPDPDGDNVDSPCDPDPRTAGDEILLFDNFGSTLNARWKPTTASAWQVKGGELVATLSAVSDQEYLATNVIGKSNISIEASYRIDKLEPIYPQHLVALKMSDPRPAGTASAQCGVTKADTGTNELVVIETNQGAMNQIVTGAFDTADLYRAGAYVSGTKAGCSVIGNGTPLGTVQATLTPDQLSTISLTARAVTVRFQYVLVVGH
jgi:hypothetical protein